MQRTPTIGIQVHAGGQSYQFPIVRIISEYRRVRRFRLVDGRFIPIPRPALGYRRVQAIVRLRSGLVTRHVDVKK